MSEANQFLKRYKEKADLNQYWYSQATIDALVQEILLVAKKAVFLSTPSVFFSLPKDSEVRQASWVFDFDAVWSKEPHYFKYDFNEPTTVPPELHHTFDCLVIDPPFITQEVWAKYAATAQLLLAPGGKVIATTVAENHQLLADLMEGMRPCLFKPSIPHLIYQYNLFTNYDSATFSKRNPEIPEDD